MKLRTQNSKLKTTFCLLLIGFCLLNGCQSSQQTQQPPAVDPKASEVILIGSDAFPLQMVGVWENKRYGWVIRIENDGRVTKLRHTIGRADLAAGERAEFPLAGGGEGFIQPGPWIVEYSMLTNEVIIDISLDSFEYDIPQQGIIRGASRDIFMGKLPAPDETSWQASWVSKPDYIATTEDREYEDYVLPFDPGDEDRGEIIFEKVIPEALDHQH